MELDEIDRKILRLLVQDSQRPLTDLSSRVGLSTTALHHRIKAYKKNNILLRYTVTLTEEFYQKQISVFVKIIKMKNSSISIAQKLKAMPEVESCYSVTGEESLLLKVRANSTKHLQEILESISKIEGVERTLSNLVIEEHFNKGTVII